MKKTIDMKHFRFVVAVIVLVLTMRAVRAQELNCTVTVNVQTLSDDERQKWATFQQDVQAYLNTYSWTTNFSGEKIQCSMAFNLTGGSSVQLFVQSNRPIGDTKQLTAVTRFLDANVSFNYTRGMALQHGVNYRELESILDYYAYIIIGLDFDSYDQETGTAALQQAQQVALVANAGQGTGWDRLITSSGAFSRIGYVEDILSANNRVLRDLWWKYHTGVLDVLATNEEKAQETLAGIIDTLVSMKRQSSDLSRSVFFRAIFDCKYPEFADFARLFKDNAELYFRKLKYLDPSHSTFYDEALAKMN